MTIIAITIIISMSVNPPLTVVFIWPLPVGVSRAIRRFVIALRVYVKYILAAPAGAFRIVLHTAQTPFPLPRHGIDRDAAQELELRIRRLPRTLHAIHQLSLIH